MYRCILQAPGCLLTSFITALMDQASAEVSYSGGGGVKLPICKIRCEALLGCCRVLLKKAQAEFFPIKCESH